MQTKRIKLAQLGDEHRYTFHGEYCRCGYKAFKKHYTPTLLLKNVTCHHQKVTDHLWFTYSKVFLELGQLRSGDIIQFNARVSVYRKGYGPSEEQTQDYQLSYPTQVKLINGHSKRMPLPTDSKHYPIVVGMAMKQNKSFYLADGRPFSQFYVNLWNSWCESHYISNESGILKQTDEARYIVKRWQREHSRITGTQYAFPKLCDYLNQHHTLMDKLGVRCFGKYYILSIRQECIVNHKQMIALLNLLHMTLTHAHGSDTSVELPSLELRSWHLNKWLAAYHTETLFIKQMLIPYLSKLYCQTKDPKQAKIRRKYLLKFLSSSVTTYNMTQLRYCILMAFVISKRTSSNWPQYYKHVIEQLLERYTRQSARFMAIVDVLTWVKKQLVAQHLSPKCVEPYMPRLRPASNPVGKYEVYNNIRELRLRVIKYHQGNMIPKAGMRKRLRSITEVLGLISGYPLPDYIRKYYPDNGNSTKLKDKFKSHDIKYWSLFFHRFMKQFRIDLLKDKKMID